MSESAGVGLSERSDQASPVRYRTIVADPPWDLMTGPPFSSGGRSRSVPYPTLTVDEIKALPVREMSDNVDEDAHLYLWTVNAYLRDAFDIARGWGFHPTQTIVWCKATIGVGLGGSWPSNVEFVLFCRRPKLTTREDAVQVTGWLYERAREAGITEERINEHMGTRRMAMWWISRNPRMSAVPRMEQWELLRDLIGFGHEMDELVAEINARKGTGEREKLSRAPSSWFDWPRGAHSTKPDAFFDLVEQVSPGPYAELFARRARFGWDYPIGDQALGGVAA